MHRTSSLAISFCLLATGPVLADETESQARVTDDSRFGPLDVFQLEFAADPQIAPGGEWIVYQRNYFDVMKDRRRANLWCIRSDGTDHRPVTTGHRNDRSPRWSPDVRTPISESEQFYQALKLRKIDTALVRVPGASHDISARPSQMLSQVAHTLEWFERHRQK